MEKQTFGIVVGDFAPLLSRHIECMLAAKDFCDTLLVIVKNDSQVKDPIVNQNANQRLKVIQSLSCVHKAYISIDNNSSVSKTIELIMGEIVHDWPAILFNFGGKIAGKTLKTCRKFKIESKILDLSDSVHKIKV